MADVLSVAASVAGLITIAEVIVRKGSKYVKGVKDADDTVKKLVHEINLLFGMLHSLRNVAEQLEEESSSTDTSTQVHHIEACYQTLSTIQDALNATMPVAPLSKKEKLKWPFKLSRTKELLVEVERHKTTMSLAVSAQEMSTLLELLARQDTLRKSLEQISIGLETDRAARKVVKLNDENKRMLDFLCTLDPRKWQDSNIRLRQPGTGVWFTDGPEFQTWLSQKESKLWVHGIAGAGKTVLAASVIQELQRISSSADSTGLAFFYCDYKDDKTHDIVTILGSLARQLISQSDACLLNLISFYHQHIEKDHTMRSPSADEICGLIQSIATHFDSVMIVIDGLDEISKNRADITKRIQNLASSLENWKALFASRLEVDLRYELEDFVQLSIAARSSDLKLYVASEIERRTKERKLRIRDEHLKEHIMNTLVKKADGMFRWVACQMDYLCECSNDLDRWEALKKLPPDIPSSYERILERLNKAIEQNQIMVQEALNWLTHAMGNFTTQHLLQALAVRDGQKKFDSRAIPTEDELLHWCSSLVRKNRTSNQLELAHFTVKEFLLSIDPLKTPNFIQYQLSDSHAILARRCMQILSCATFDDNQQPSLDESLCDLSQEEEEEFWDKWQTFIDKYCFLKYAYEYWDTHAHDCNYVYVKECLTEMLLPEHSTSSLPFWLFTYLACTSKDYGYGFGYEFDLRKIIKIINQTSTLHWAAYFALDEICSKLIEEGSDVNSIGSFGTPLRFALLNMNSFGNDPIWNDVGWEPSYRRSHISSEKRVLRQLLQAGAIYNYPSAERSSQRTPLEIALKIDETCVYDYSTATIFLELGYRISATDLRNIITNVIDVVEDWIDFWDKERDNSSLREPIHKVSTSPQKHLEREAYSILYQFMLDSVARGASTISLLQRIFPDPEIFSPPQVDEINQQLGLQSQSPLKRAITVLVMAVLFCASSDAETTKTLQSPLKTAIREAENQIGDCFLEVYLELSPTSLTQYPRLLDELLRNGHFGRGSLKVVEALMNLGVNPNEFDDGSQSAIEFAAKCVTDPCTLEIFRLLWNAEKNMNFSRFPNSSIPKVLSSIFDLNEKDLLKELMQDLCAVESTRITTIDFALSQDDYSIVQLVSDILAYKNCAGNTVLHVLSAGVNDGDLLCKKLRNYTSACSILNIHSSINEGNDAQWTPIALSIRSGNNTAISPLVNAGADVAMKYRDGQTALHLAACFGNKKAVQLLLDLGACPNSWSDMGQTPKDIAIEYGYTELANLFPKRSDTLPPIGPPQGGTDLPPLYATVPRGNRVQRILPLRLLDPKKSEVECSSESSTNHSAIDVDNPEFHEIGGSTPTAPTWTPVNSRSIVQVDESKLFESRPPRPLKHHLDMFDVEPITPDAKKHREL